MLYIILHSLKKILLLLAAVAFMQELHAQTISGPGCVTKGGFSTYSVSGGGQISYLSWCVTGGTISGSSCSSGTVYSVTVAWSNSGSGGTVTLNTSSPSSYSSLNVTFASTLLSGSITANPTQTITYNTIPAAINCSATSGGSCGSATYAYQWQKSTDNISWTNITGATALNLGFSAPITQTTYYNRLTTVSSPYNTILSATATVFVTPPLSGGTVTALSPVDYGQSPGTFSSTASASAGTCSGAYTYQWQQSIDNVNWFNTSGGNALAYTSPALLQTTYYRRKVSCGIETAYSNLLTITVIPQLLSGSVSPTLFTIAANTSPGTITGSAASGGSCGTFSYQWQSSADGTSFTDISAATAIDYTPGNLTATTYYRRKVTCGTQIQYSNVTAVLVDAGGNNLSYIKERTFSKPGIISVAVAAALTDPLDVQQATQYFDGLGRPVQTVAMKATPLQKDLVAINVYDNIGREEKKYLPYVATTNDGNYKATYSQDQYNFNNAQFAGENFYYGQAAFEPSPLNRVSASYAPGLNWAGASRGISSQYLVNAANESVRIWTIAAAPGSLPASSSLYLAGTLFKNAIIDESNHQVVEYKDRQGNVILKKVQLAVSPGLDHVGWLCTYYVYDDLNNLRFVLQPRCVELINTNWTLTQALVDELCFRYEYDGRKRMIIKKVPGAGEAWMVYDNRDRPVMNQDANMRATGKWMVTEYDTENRPWRSGLLTEANNRSYHQNLAGTSISYPNTISNYEVLSQTFFDNYSWVAGTGSTITSAIDAANTSSSVYFNTTYNTSPSYAQAITPGYMLRGLPTGSKIKVTGTTNQYLYTASFVDNRGRPIQAQSINYSGGKDIVTSQYDFSGKLIRHLLQHTLSGTNAQAHKVLTKMNYDAGGRLLTLYKNIDDAPGDILIVTNTYNELGQLKTKKLSPAYNSGLGLETLNYDYNIRGWLLGANRDFAKTKSTTTNYFGFDLGYDKTAIKPTTLSSIGAYTTPAYNGNIGGMVWKSRGDDEIRKYDFSYDNINRLLAADFNQYTASAFNKTANVDFSVKMGDGINYATAYDAIGNIKQMQQWGLKLNTSSQVDNLTYNYTSNSNKLLNVIDAVNDATTKLGDFRASALYQQTVATKTAATTDYTYDANGNLKRDYNKDIGNASADGIQYNHLNLPTVITVKKDATNNKGTITYTYDAAGNKLQKQTIDIGTVGKTITTTTSYISGFVYESRITSPANNPNDDYTNVLQFTGHEEGRIKSKTDGTFAYDYFIKDHLGNVRMVLTDEISTIYYPAATVEGTYGGTTNSMINYEKGFYNIDNTKVTAETAIPSWVSPAETVANTKLYYNNNGNPPANLSYPAGCIPTQTAGSGKVYKLNATANKTGLEFMIKVMAGDKVDIFGKSYYLNTAAVTNTNSTTLDVLSLLTNLLLSPSNAASGKGISASQLNTINSGVIPSTFFRGSNSEAATTVPKAYINYIFLDEQFKYAGGGASRVGISGSIKDHWYADAQLQNISAPKNGYIFVYVSNESNLDVFFDNLQVVHKPGPMLEETHYYPFGLTMAGISSKAAGKLENEYKFTGKELQAKEFFDGSGLEWTDFGARMYDQQIGRWHVTDGKAELYFATSPYVYALNQPTNAIDPDGNLVIFIQGNHFGETGHQYWTAKNYSTTTGPSGQTPPGYHSINGRGTTTVYGKDRYFDNEVMNQLNDNHTPRYYDGSGWGYHTTGLGNPMYTTAHGRFNEGKEQGAKDAEIIIKNLERDPNHNIIETIKIVTHSMGGAYGKGFVAALKAYIKTLPAEQQQQIKIEQVIDFDPYQGEGMTADGKTTTFQYIHFGWLANEEENGNVQQKKSNSSSAAHSIFSFFADINQLHAGTYKWNPQTQSWDLQL